MVPPAASRRRSASGEPCTRLMRQPPLASPPPLPSLPLAAPLLPLLLAADAAPERDCGWLALLVASRSSKL